METLSYFFRNSKPFSQLIGLFFFTLLGFVLTGGISMLLPSGGNVTKELINQGLCTILTFFLPAVLFTVCYKESCCEHLHLAIHSRQWILTIVAIVVLILWIPANDWLSYWNDGWSFGPQNEFMRSHFGSGDSVAHLLSQSSWGDLLLQLLVVALVTAISEEFFFRGVLQQIFCEWFGSSHVAIAVTALLFGLAHGNVYAIVPLFIFGLIFGYMYRLSGTIWVTVCAHFFNNAAFVLMYFMYHRGVLDSSPGNPLMVPWLTTLLCTLAAAILFAVYFVKNASLDSQE